MNEMIQNNLFVIIIFLLFIILLLMGLIGFVLFKLLNQRKVELKNQRTETYPPITSTAPKSKYNIPEPVVEKYYCQNHKETASSGGCLICEDVFCDKCLVEHEGMYFCKDHFRIFANHKWKQITDVKTTPDSPEEGLFVWDFKRYIWKNKNIPTFVLTHYKINVDQDFIESYVQLNVRDSDEIDLKNEIENFKAKH